MVCILDLPLDAWVVIMIHLDVARLPSAFEQVFELLNISKAHKLDTFFVVVSQARFVQSSVPFDSMPDATPYREVCTQLVDMGFSRDDAMHVSSQSNGNLLTAFDLLGW